MSFSGVSNFTPNWTDHLKNSEVEEKELVKSFTIDKEESSDVIQSMGRLKKFSYNYIYQWTSHNRFTASKRTYVPSNLDRIKFLEKTEFTAKIKSIHNDGTVTVLFSHPLRDETQGIDIQSINETVLSIQTLPNFETLEKMDAKN